jgi:hypothetical protein
MNRELNECSLLDTCSCAQTDSTRGAYRSEDRSDRMLCSNLSFALEEGQTCTSGWIRLTKKHNAGWFWLVMHWEKGKDEPWYLVSDRPGERQLTRLYRLRMWIEEMYGDFKGHGFDLEATHLRCAQRIHHLLLGVRIAYVSLIALGSSVVKNDFRHLIDHKSRRDKSYFRLGWDWIARCFRINEAVPIRFVPYYLE